MNKKTLTIVALTAGIGLLGGCSSSEPTIEPGSTLVSLYNAGDTDSTVSNVDIQYVSAKGAITNNKEDGLQVDFLSAQHSYSAVVFTPTDSWDWSSLDDFNLAFDISNSGDHSVQVYLDISDKDGANYTRSVNIPVNSSHTYYAKMAGHDLGTPDGDEDVELNFLSGLRSNPDTWESDDIQFISLWGKKNLNLSGITKISLSVQSALHDKQITIHDIRLRQNQPFNTQYLTNIVDKYGQNASFEYDYKIRSDADLAKQRDEEAEILDGKLATHLSKWGGWKEGPKLEGTGFFRTAKVDGKWSLVDPDGYLYFATGLDVIRLSNSSTMTGYDFPQSQVDKRAPGDVTPEDSQGLNRVSDSIVDSRFVASELRKDLFQWLPEYDEPMGKHYGYRKSAHSGPLSHGETYSFYAANLDRKYSPVNPDYMQEWRDVTINRMINWGFSSLGNWTDPSLYNNDRIPYFANGWIIGNFKTVSSGNDFWAPLPDVFDPEFARRADVTASQIAAEVKGSPWCVGIFVDNEKSFGRSESNEALYGIVIHTLGRDGKDVPTKAAFTASMKAKYGDIASLNNAWEKDIASWEAFDAGIDSSLTTDAQLEDYSTLLTLYADKYFSIVDKALNKYLPNHMYLGARFPDWGMPIEVVKASAKYVDVVSYNVYKEGLHPAKWDFLSEIDMPSIIGEYHMGAIDQGLYHPGLIMASNQEDRAKMYTDYMHSVIDNPYFIGAHWFQYIDSPITGRAYDGENYNVGFITVTDTPYAPMIEAARKLHGDMYQRRFKQ